LAEQTVDGLHVLDKRRTPPQGSRARDARLLGRGRVRGPKFEVFGTSNFGSSLSRVSPASRVTAQGCWRIFPASCSRVSPNRSCPATFMTSTGHILLQCPVHGDWSH